MLDDGTELPFDLFLGVPKHRAPDVVIASGMTEDGYVPGRLGHAARRATPGVYAVGDVATAGVPKAGVFAEGAARIVAQAADRRAARRRARPAPYLGRGTCYIEFGGGRVGRVDIDFLSGPDARPGTFNAPSAALVAEKEEFGSSRRARWFGASRSPEPHRPPWRAAAARGFAHTGPDTSALTQRPPTRGTRMSLRTAITVHRSRDEIARLWEAPDHRTDHIEHLDASPSRTRPAAGDGDPRRPRRAGARRKLGEMS